MTNVSCKQLIIDRSKSEKVGTVKDISLFANVAFPKEGAFKGGIILRPLAGMGKTTSKSQQQMSQISGRKEPIAGSTGATVTEVEMDPEPASTETSSSDESYAVRFIQHSCTNQQSLPSLSPSDVDSYAEYRPASGYALKHGSGKRTVFSQAQKDILLEFYNRQAINKIRAETKDAIRAMEAAGLEVLSVTQIRSWS